MNTHEQLLEICKKINYRGIQENPEYIIRADKIIVSNVYQREDGSTGYTIVDEREIIYTVEFLSKFENYLNNYDVWRDSWKEDFYKIIENPTEYLYNLLINYGPDADDN